MSKVFDYSGDDGFAPGGSMYSNPLESSLFLSLGRHVDVYFPSRKRSRISAPLIFTGERLKKQKQPSIEVLPDECLFEIFRRVPIGQERSACACVSKRWLTLVSNISTDENSISTKVEEIESEGYLSRCLEGKKATDIRLASIAVGTAARGGLGKLLIRGKNSTRGLTNLGLRAISHGCPSLRALSLWNVSSIGDEGLFEIGNGCHKLEKLDLSHCPSISDKGLLAIAQGCPSLTDLTLESSNIGNEGLQAISRCCPNLKSISIKDCPLVGDQGIASVVSSASQLTKMNLQNLNITDMSLAVIGHYGKALTDMVISNLQNVNEKGFWVMGNGHGLQKLKSFAITSCRGVTDIGLEAIAKGCPNLKQFSLSKCAFFSDMGLVCFAGAAQSLESLQLEECHRITQYGVFGTLVKTGLKLKSLVLANCLGIKDTVSNLPQMSPCESLRSLSIRNCTGFGNACLVVLGKLCPQLQNIELTGLHGVSDAGLFPLVKSCEAGLVKVNLSGCVNLSDNVVSAIAMLHGSSLELLNLDGCVKVSDASLVVIAEKCFCLSDLDLSMSSITDMGIAALTRSKQLNLLILSLSGCLVSEKSLASLLKLGQTLLGLNLQQCSGITSRVVDLLIEHLWRCDILS